jgi:copper chaperone CopZ
MECDPAAALSVPVSRGIFPHTAMNRPVTRFSLWMVAALLAVAPGCRLRDERTVTISTPGIHNEACARRARTELLRLKGVEGQSIRFDLEARTVTVTYDSLQLGRKNLEHAICDAGFDANDLKAPAEAVANLPPSCREATAPASDP